VRTTLTYSRLSRY